MVPLIDMFNLKDAFTSAYNAVDQSNVEEVYKGIVSDLTEEGVSLLLDKKDLYLVPESDAKDEDNRTTAIFRTDAPGGVNNVEPLRKRVEPASNNFDNAVVPKPLHRKIYVTPGALDPASLTKNDESLDKWFGMKQKKLTPEVVRELKALQLRGSADPKRFFKTTDMKKLPTHFQFATTVRASALTATGEETQLFDHGRKRKPRSLVSDLLRNEAVQAFTKKKALAACAAGISGNRKSYKDKVARKAYKKRR